MHDWIDGSTDDGSDHVALAHRSMMLRGVGCAAALLAGRLRGAGVSASAGARCLCGAPRPAPRPGDAALDAALVPVPWASGSDRTARGRRAATAAPSPLPPQQQRRRQPPKHRQRPRGTTAAATATAADASNDRSSGRSEQPLPPRPPTGIDTGRQQEHSLLTDGRYQPDAARLARARAALLAQPAHFVASCTTAAALPPARRPECAFMGRSNVGKSSLLNALMDSSTLVRTSRQPGQTRSLNYFRAGPVDLVDMPGYGFRSRTEWFDFIGHYLESRITYARVRAPLRRPIANRVAGAACGRCFSSSTACTASSRAIRTRCSCSMRTVSRLRCARSQHHALPALHAR